MLEGERIFVLEGVGGAEAPEKVWLCGVIAPSDLTTQSVLRLFLCRDLITSRRSTCLEISGGELSKLGKLFNVYSGICKSDQIMPFKVINTKFEFSLVLRRISFVVENYL